MWVVQLSGVIGALPLVAAAAALLRRFRLATQMREQQVQQTGFPAGELVQHNDSHGRSS